MAAAMTEHTRQPIVAIDGPAGSGKSTIARLVARCAGLCFISSGAMYRAVALLALRAGVAATEQDRLVALASALNLRFCMDAEGQVHSFLDGEEVTDALRQPAVAQLASTIAVIPELRAQLVAKQQAYGREGGVVMEGRDIQTVVFPHADIKIFLNASQEERARRRWKELIALGEVIDYATVLAEVCDRDARDETRDASPLRAAPDALLLDTEGKTIDEVVHCVVTLLQTWQNNPSLQGESLARAAKWSQ